MTQRKPALRRGSGIDWRISAQSSDLITFHDGRWTYFQLALMALLSVASAVIGEHQSGSIVQILHSVLLGAGILFVCRFAGVFNQVSIHIETMPMNLQWINCSLFPSLTAFAMYRTPQSRVCAKMPSWQATCTSGQAEPTRGFTAAGARNVRVFGSVGRGEDSAGSDIDLLVDFAQPLSRFALSRLEAAPSAIAGAKVDVVPSARVRASTAGSARVEAVRL